MPISRTTDRNTSSLICVFYWLIHYFNPNVKHHDAHLVSCLCVWGSDFALLQADKRRSTHPPSKKSLHINESGGWRWLCWELSWLALTKLWRIQSSRLRKLSVLFVYLSRAHHMRVGGVRFFFSLFKCIQLRLLIPAYVCDILPILSTLWGGGQKLIST